MSPKPGWLWIGALVGALLLLGVDSARRVDAIERATAARVGGQPAAEVDPGSRTGYRWNQHRLLLTQTDGYQWVLQTEQAIERGALRVRLADYDNAPAGREVHWAGPMRWWGQGLAGAYRVAAPELTMAQALERVAPWANALLLAALLIAVTPLLAHRFGALPASLFALGAVAASPFYELFAAGYFDHHGLAAMCCALAVLLMVGGGCGWLRSEDEPVRPRPQDRLLVGLLPPSRTARRWIAGSGVVSAVAVWISAATAAPALIGLGLAGLVSAVACSRVPPAAHPPRAPWRFDPGLLRLWGIAGAAGSFSFYLLEYFPGDLGMRLEVNHPLYALAFLGAGDLLARVAGREGAPPTAARLWLVADVAAVATLPAVILFTGESTFRVSDAFLWVLHDRYIDEFLPLHAWMLTRPPATVVAELSLVPLAALPLAAVLWPTALEAGLRWAWRSLLVVLVAAAAAYAYVFVLAVTRGNQAVALVGAAAALASWLAWPWLRGAPEVPPPARAMLLAAALPALVLLVLALLQLRWLGTAVGLSLVTLVAVAGVVHAVGHPFARSTLGRVISVAWMSVALPLPVLLSMRRPFTPANIDAITRDASSWLRQRLGERTGVVLASPTATTQMIWFGGFRGLGTLYWENLEGLRASAEIYGASDPDSARAALVRRGVTHVAFYAWDAGLEHLLVTDHVARAGGGLPAAEGVLHRLELELRGERMVDLPPWLVPLPYVPPRVAGYGHPIVHLFEVVDEMPAEVGLARLARYYMFLGDPRMDEALARSLEVGPSVPGLAMSAQLERLRGNRPVPQATIAQLRQQLSSADVVPLEDRLEAAIAFGLAGDGAEISRQVDIVLAQADEAQLRRVPTERLSLLVELSRQLGLEAAHRESVALALRLVEERGDPSGP